MEIDAKLALIIANAFFKGLDGTKATSLKESASHFVADNIPEGEVRIGGGGVKIDKLTGEADDFILPDDENFKILEDAKDIDISSL